MNVLNAAKPYPLEGSWDFPDGPVVKNLPSNAGIRELPRVPLRGEGSCGVGGASRDSAGSGAMEEGLTSRGGRNLRLPLCF